MHGDYWVLVLLEGKQALLEIGAQHRPLEGLNGYSFLRFPTGSRIDASGIEQLNRKTGKSTGIIFGMLERENFRLHN